MYFKNEYYKNFEIKFENKIIKIPYNQIEELEKELKIRNIFVVKIDGNDVKTAENYLSLMDKKFDFYSTEWPTAPDNFNGHNDWMRDLTWIDANGYAIIVYNFKEFLRNDPKNKEWFLNIFENLILPYWAGGSESLYYTKEFNLYLVD